MKHNPWFKLWAQDWLTDIELRSCPSAQRGTLIDLMCIAHRHDPYGVIMDEDTPANRKMLAKCLSITVRTLDSHIAGLLQMQRICRTDGGQLYIKRMTADHRKSLQASEYGKKAHRQTHRGTHRPEAEAEAEKKQKQIPATAFALAESLLYSIKSWKPDFRNPTPSTLETWAADIDRAMRLDGRSEERLVAVIKWLPTHVDGGFLWRNQILSGKKLRDKFDRLEIAMKKPQARQKTFDPMHYTGGGVVT